ncbi:hypothetical protein PR048_029711 [Dryococelus australis]|uniref:Uncharacterized protein n=1 Tax=Dryococelus australis TaxID=614101 RepID=A0ABQ9GG22_9NEOP|nr:hypothetical protein PR048_029711 [Dryococelus australis]
MNPSFSFSMMNCMHSFKATCQESLSQRSWGKFLELHLAVLTSTTLKIHSHENKLTLANTCLTRYLQGIICFATSSACIPCFDMHLLHSLKCIQKVAELMPMAIKSCDIDKL